MKSLLKVLCFLVVAEGLLFWGEWHRSMAPLPPQAWELRYVQPKRPNPPPWPRGVTAVPRGVRVEASSDRSQFFLGENPVVRLTVTNRGATPFWIYEGGDSRGGTRAWRFSIKVRDERGEELPDPMPEQAMMGGLGKAHFLQLGESHTYTALLSRYALVEQPGRYEVEVSHDLGTQPFPRVPRPDALPVARLALVFVEPSPTQAREIAANAEGLWKWPTRDSRSEEMTEYASLRFPEYLPFVNEALRRGKAEAAQALGHMSGQGATEHLVRWAADPDATHAVRSAALLMLAARAPIADPHWRSVHVVIAPAILREGAWNDELRRAGLALARERLKAGFALAGDEATAAAALVGALGDADDADRLLALWRELMERHREAAGKGVSVERGPSGYSLAFALDQLRGRGWSLPFPVTDEGDTHLWLFFAQREKQRGVFSGETRTVLAALREHAEARVRSQVEELLRPPAVAR